MSSLRSLLRGYRSFASLAAASCLAAASAFAQYSYTGGTYTQTFDTLASTGTANTFEDNVTLPGWYAASGSTSPLWDGTTGSYVFPTTFTTASDAYAANNGSGSAGDLYSFGTTSSTDRALGSVGSGNAIAGDFIYGIALKNDSGSALSALTVSYDGEQWRRAKATADTLYVLYRIGGSALDGSGSWIPVPALYFTSPEISSSSAAALDGNAAGNRASLSTTIPAAVAAGETVWLVWVDQNSAGNDHALAIDNVSITGIIPVAEAPSINSSSTASGTANSPFSYTITATNSPTSFGASGLPSTLTVDTATGVISGTPTAPGTYAVTLSATNASGTGTATLALTIAADSRAPVISTGQIIEAYVGTPLSYTLATNGQPATFTCGNLPPGLSFDTATGVISGTPTTPTTYRNVEVTATNDYGSSATTITIYVYGPPVIRVDSTVLAVSGVAFTYSFYSNNTAISVVANGLPEGLSHDGASTISGTTTAVGSYTVTIIASNANGVTSVTFTLNVVEQSTLDNLPTTVVVNKFVNGTPDQVELLVIGDGTAGSTADLRGMILKDFGNENDNDSGGRYQFADTALWQAVPAGTLIVLSTTPGSGSPLDQDFDGSDYVLRVNLANTAYFTGTSTFDIATTDMVMIKAAGTGGTGVLGGIHALASGSGTSPGDQVVAYTGKKLTTSATSGTNKGVYANNSTSTLADFNGTDATGNVDATSLVFGAGNTTTNQAYIDSLRAPLTTALEDWRQTYFGSIANTGSAADTADYDGDGVSNLLEYAFGTNPTVASASPVVLATNSGGYLTLTFPRVNDSSLTYTVFATNDLATAATTTGVSFPGAATSATYVDSVLLSSVGGKRFLRVVVTY